MNREIKFRAWDDRGKGEWLSVRGNATFDLDDVMRSGSELDERPFNDIRVTLMQYTGLKDRNGREIFEGDVVRVFKTNYDGRKVEWTSPVRFKGYDDREQAFDGEHLGWVLDDSEGSHESHTTLPDAVGYGCEVVGNIYENGDLLTPPA